MSARIEVQAPVRHSLRPFLWALAIALFVAAALWIWNMGGGSTSVQKTEKTIPITKTAEAPAVKTIEARYRALARLGTTAAPGENGSGTGVATSPQQR
jgi:hypothetical protein